MRDDGIPTFFADSISFWRKWLTENHDKQKSIWLIIYHKDSNTESITYNEAVDEALCFGWVDSSTWTALEDVDHLIVKDDLMSEFLKNKKAFNFWKSFPPSSKRNILEWIFNAKRDETRNKRIQETVKLAAENIRANHYRQPKNK